MPHGRIVLTRAGVEENARSGRVVTLCSNVGHRQNTTWSDSLHRISPDCYHLARVKPRPYLVNRNGCNRDSRGYDPAFRNTFRDGSHPVLQYDFLWHFAAFDGRSWGSGGAWIG